MRQAGVKSLVVAIATAGLLLSVPAAASAAGGGITVRPAHHDPADPATKAYFKPVVTPGASFTDQVIVGNSSDQPIDVIVSPVDGVTGQTSGAVYANRQDPVRETGAWITVGVTALTVAPHQEVPVAFTARVPSDAAPGDHLAGLAFEDANPQTSGGSVQVKKIMRTVVGVQLRVSGPATFHADVDRVALQSLGSPGAATAVVTVGNDGRALGKPDLTVRLTRPGGYDRTMTRKLDTILPGDTIDYPWAWPDELIAGTYDVTVTAVGGGSTVTKHFTVRVGKALPGPGTPSSPRPPADATRSSGGIPSWAFLVATALAGLVGGFVLRRRPGRSRPSVPDPIPGDDAAPARPDDMAKSGTR